MSKHRMTADLHFEGKDISQVDGMEIGESVTLTIVGKIVSASKHERMKEKGGGAFGMGHPEEMPSTAHLEIKISSLKRD